MDSERYYNLTDEELTLEFCPQDIKVSGKHKTQAHAYIETYRRFWDKVYFVAHQHLKTAHAAEEVVHEVFLLLWKKREVLNIKSLEQHLAAMTRYMVYRYMAKTKMKRDLQKKTGNEVLDANLCSIDLDRYSAQTDQLILEMINRTPNKFPKECRIVLRKIPKESKNMMSPQNHFKVLKGFKVVAGWKLIKNKLGSLLR